MRKHREYINLNEVYTNEELESENYKINYVSLTKDQVIIEKIRNSREYWAVRGLQHDFNYVRLIKKGDGIMMSDTPMERNTNYGFLTSANGDVIIFGLGLGLIVLPLLKDKDVKSVTVVELYQDLIDLVSPVLKKHDTDNKLTIVQGDAFNYPIEKGKKFDTIYFDIWIGICVDNYEEQKKLTRKYSKYLNRENPNKFMDCWMKGFYVRQIRREKREERRYVY